MKNYNKAPLPFQGQKRSFVKKFKKALHEFPNNSVYVDLFGGSGLLSHTVKMVHPNAKVIYNDFDNYSERIQNVDKTNNLIRDIKKFIAHLPSGKRIENSIKLKVLERIKQESGFVDYISISSQVLFSGKYANDFDDLSSEIFYKRVVNTEYNADGYLQVIEFVSLDYKILFDRFKDLDNVVFIVDPPYLSTDAKSYKAGSYWKLSDYLNIIRTIENRPYFYFTSNKSQIVELFNWLDNNNYGCSPFANATVKTTTNRINYSSGY